MTGSTYETGDLLDGVREYAEGWPVKLMTNDMGRLVVIAVNEGGQNCVEIDLSDLLAELERRALLGVK